MEVIIQEEQTGGHEELVIDNVNVASSLKSSEQQVNKELLCCGRVLRFVTNLTKTQADEFSKFSRVQIYFKLITTMVFSVLDIGTDVWLMFQYFLGGQYLYGVLTLAFVWVPAFFNIYDLYRICGIKNNNTWLYQQLINKKWLLIILYIVPLASAVVALNNFILLWKRKMNKWDNRRKTGNLLSLQMNDSYLEALPQLTLQLSVILNNVEQETQDTSFMNMLRLVSMAFSVFTVTRVTYSFSTSDTEIEVIEAVPQFTRTLFLIVSRVLVMSMGFAVSPTVAGVCLLLHWSVVAVADYREFREEQYTVTDSIIVSVVYAIKVIFNYEWYSPGFVICCKISARMFTYTMYTLQCVVFTTLWCILNSRTHGTVWYYAVPAVFVLLYILYVTAVLLERHFRNKQ